MISLGFNKYSPEDMIFVMDEDPDRTVMVRRCEEGKGYVIRISNGPGRYQYLSILADTAERLTHALIDAQNYKEGS